MRVSHTAVATVMAVSTLIATAPVRARAQAFTFDDAPIGFSSGLLLRSGPQQLTVTSVGSGSVLIDDLAAGVPGLGLRSATGVSDDAGTFLPLRFSFLHPVGAITFAFGDDGGDDDVPVVIEAYDTFGALLHVLVDDTYEFGVAEAHTLTGTFAGRGAQYFLLRTDGVVPNSLYFEVQASTMAVVPEPSTLLLTAGGLTAAAGWSARRRGRRSENRFPHR